MAMDIKALLKNKWTLSVLGAGSGYVAGKKYIKRKRGEVYGAIGGALAGYVVGRMMEPKAAVAATQPGQLTEAEIAAAARQIQSQPGTVLRGLDEYVDFDDAPATTVAPGVSAQHAARVQREMQEALRPPPRSEVTNIEDLSEGWNGSNGSLSGGLGEYVSDEEIDELIDQASRNRN